jgi:iron complex outermembrane receptor protein
MRKLTITIIILMIGVHQVAANPADSEDLTDLSVEELLNVEVISASRLAQKASQAPSAVSVLTATDIRAFGWRTLADALNGVRGLFTLNDRNYSFLGVRGFIRPDDYNSRVLLMIDGQRMNENIYDGGYIGQEFMLDTDLIERIEFIPGSGSSIYGANAFLGLVNVVTKQGKALDGAQVAGEIGRYDAYKGRFSYGKKFANDTDVLVSASHYDSAGVSDLYISAYDSPATNNGIAHNMDAERADRLFAKIRFSDFTLSGGFVDRFKRVPTAAYGQIFNDPLSHTVDQQFFGDLKYNKALTDKTALMLKAYYQGYDYHADDHFYDGGVFINHDQVTGRWFGGEVQMTTSAFDRQRLIAGLEYQYDQQQNELNYVTNPYEVLLDSNRRGHRVEAYIQDDIQVFEDLVLSAGLRFDYHHLIQHLPINPRLGLIWSPLTSTTLKLLYSSTFRAPNIAELDYNPFYFAAAPALKEERISSYEGIVEWRPANGIKLTGSVFYNAISRLLETQPTDPDGLLGNFGQYEVYGAEWEAERRWVNGRLLKASYTYSQMLDSNQPNTRIVGSPEHLFKLHYAEPLFDGFAKVGVEQIFIGDRKTGQGNLADAYSLINVNMVSERIVKGLVLSFGVYNLLDDHYQVLGSGVNNILLMNGREFRLKMQLDF